MITSDIKQKRTLAGIKTITDNEIKEMQMFYDSGKTLNECQEKYGYSRRTLIKYLYTRPRGNSKLTEEERKNRRVKSVVSWRSRTKQKLVDYKGGKCEKCEYNKCIQALEFHHLDPKEKDFTISGKSWSFERLKKEVDKCILVCNRCHTEIHYQK